MNANGYQFSAREKFSSFDDLKAAITQFESNNFVQLWIRDARTIEAARKCSKESSNNNVTT